MRAFFAFPDPVNEKAARTVAAVVAGLSVLILLTGWLWLLVPLAYGFVARVLAGPRLSPLGALAMKVIAPRLGTPVLTPGPPKRFAQGIGAVLTITAAGLGLGLGLAVPALLLTGVLAAFALLESVLGFCAGCWVFGHLMSWGLIPEETCERCANLRPGHRADDSAALGVSFQEAVDLGVVDPREHAGGHGSQQV